MPENEGMTPTASWVGNVGKSFPVLTKREEFIKAAMQGILSDGGNKYESPEHVGQWAVAAADATLAEAERTKP